MEAGSGPPWLTAPPLRFAAGADAGQLFKGKAQTLLDQADACHELSSSLAHDGAWRSGSVAGGERHPGVGVAALAVGVLRQVLMVDPGVVAAEARGHARGLTNALAAA